jgi:Protein of unknown function (DUF1592)/Protein of unknown function (DUF1588)/Protein of unknown function (DUF1595)/Protein of unknown function (DUF1587)
VRRLGIVSLALGLALGCTGNIGEGSGGSTKNPGGKKNPTDPTNPDPTVDPTKPPPDDPTKPPSAQITCPSNGMEIVGKRALRRLTIPELEATIRATFGLTATQWVGLNVPPDAGSEDGFTNNVDRLTVSPEYARGLMESSRAVANLVSGDLLAKLVPCAATGGTTCADTFVTSFGTKLYRRPLTPAEKARYMALFDKTSKEDFKSFVYWTTSTLLQSPNTLYRSELGESDGKGRFKLNAYEVASQLSYTYTGGPPTPELMQLAAANKLGTPDEVEAAARALMFDGTAVKPAFRDVVLGFADQWLGISRVGNVKKDAMLYPDFSPQVQDALAEETRQFLSSVILTDKGTVSDLLTAPYTMVDSRLAKYYGFGTATGTGFTKTTRPAEWGIGLLAQGSLQAVHANGLYTSPTRRGHMVRTLMCDTVPPPPPTVNPVAEVNEFKTTRQRYEELHSANPECHSCHMLMDPIGFAFEHIDSAGRYRLKEGTFDIDDSAVVTRSSGDLTVKGPTELANALSKLPEVSECMASYMAAYALGVSHDSAQCLVSSATAELLKGTSIVDFYVRMARADHFRYRQ